MFKVAALTMVKDDAFFLERWVRHYAAQLGGREHLYVVTDGPEPELRAIAEGCSVILSPFDPAGEHFERRRWAMLQKLTEALAVKYDCVITGDVDELVVVDPDTGCATLPDYLGRLENPPPSLAPFGVNMIHLPSREPDPIGDTILGPRRHFETSALYTKPCVIFRPDEAPLQIGGHARNGVPWNIATDLVTFHLKFVDREVALVTADRRNERMKSILTDGARTHGTWGWGKGNREVEKKIERLDARTRGRPLRQVASFRLPKTLAAWRRHYAQAGQWPVGTDRGPMIIPDRFIGLF